MKILPREKAATEDMLRRFAREARAASSLNHPNIITVFEIGQAVLENVRVDFIAMELVNGETLRSFLSQRFEMTNALHYLAQTADGLAKAHAAGIIHRDLKPENIMITSDGFAKVLDFGLAKAGEPEGSASDEKTAVRSDPLSHVGMVMGTVDYMSPEQVRGSVVDNRSDIFSFGCILYEVASGRQPFRGNSTVNTFHKIAYEPPPPIGEVDPPATEALKRVIRKCLAKDPEERYQSAKEIAIDLREIRREYESGEHLSGAVVRPKLVEHGRSRSRWFGIAAASLVLALAGWLWNTRARHGTPTDRGRFESMTIDRLTNTANAESAEISADGRYIAYVKSTPKGDVIWVRQVASGSEIEVAPADEEPYRELRFSNDGEYIRYVHRSSTRQSPVLGGSDKILIDKFSHSASFAPDGNRFAFIRDGSLFVANIDGSGERRIAGSTSREFYVRPAWSPRGDRIACVRRSLIKTIQMWIEIVGPDDLDSVAETAGRPTVLGERWFAITSMTWLPDGKGIAVSASQRPLSERQLYEISYPEGQTRRITNDLFEYDGVSITADGRTLISRQTDKRSSIWLVPRDHSEKARRLVEGAGSVSHVAAHPDGGFLFAASSRGAADIWRSAIDGTDRKQLTDDEQNDWIPAVSPDGRTIAFVSDRSGQMAIWKMDADGSHQTKVTPGEWENAPRFSPDGTWLVYTSRASGDAALRRIAIDGGAPASIPGRWRIRPAISPDGQMIAAVADGWKIGVISASDGTPIRSFEESADTELRWTKDSRALAYSRHGVLYLQKLDGSAPNKIVDFNPDAISSFDWTADGKSLICVRTAYQHGIVVLKHIR